MAVLTKYSKTKDTQSSDYTTQKQYIDSLRTIESLPLPDDFRTPFSYQEWLQRNSGMIPGRDYDQYNQYLKEWHKNTYTVSDTVQQVKEDYYALLQELSVAFSTPEDAEWFANIDLTNPLDLEDAIPLFTKKLKEIAIYFVNKRDAIKKAKLKYNMVGSTNAVKRLFYEYLLKAFTQREYVLNVPEQSAYDTFPELSAVKDGFQIFIEELYDDTSYFDKDPIIPITSYYDLTAPDVLEYYNTINFDVSALPWLFSTGVSDINSDNPLLWSLSSELAYHGVTSVQELPLSAFSQFDRVLLNKYISVAGTQKYLGEQQYIISGGYYELDTRTIDHDFISGNNWFYWPTGEYFRESETDIIFDPILLADTTLITDGAVAATNYRDSDKIFTQVDQVISGAWLRYTEKYIDTKLMQATLFSESNTRFKFPFPGYGLSGEGVEWSGPLLKNVIPMQRYDENILNTYWKTTSLSAIEPISIHDTTLIDSGAISHQEYGPADKISIRVTQNPDKIHDINPNSTYKETFDRAWLYKMLKTDLPITVGQNYINWPIHTYDKDATDMDMLVPSSQCAPIYLSSINVESTIIGARAGHGIFDSDLIYKLDAPNGYPIECAWLSGAPLDSLAGPDSTLMYNATGKIQPSLTLRCRPGRTERFVWYDEPTNISDTTLVHHEHQTDCPYYLTPHKSINKTYGVSLAELNTNGIGDWNECKCRAIKYSPLGHPGSKYSDYSYMTDIVFVDTQFPNEFDINTWIGTDLSSYDTSKDFAYFQLDSGNRLEPDVGWGPGSWKTGDGSEFQFKPGVVYKYLRANLKRNPADLIFNAVPDLIVKQTHKSTPPAIWMRATLNEDGTWEKTTDRSTIVLNPGNYLMYDHIDSNWYCLSTDGDVGETYSQLASTINFGTNWASYDYVTIGNDVSYFWPNKLYVGGPTHILSELSAVTWMVNEPISGSMGVTEIDPVNSFTFVAEKEGIYTVSAIGYGRFGSEVVTMIPDLTCVQQSRTLDITGALGIETTYNDRINMTINIPLTGWNYTDNVYNGTSCGARPFWAKAYDTSVDQTKNKATLKWGGGIRTTIDDYTYVTQPDVATLTLSSNDYVNYVTNGNISLTWNQPVNFIINESKSEWCSLEIDQSKVSPLTDYLYNITNEMVVSATETPSNIYLSNSDNMLVNYWCAGEGFTWSQTIVNSTNGFPPTGGRWIVPISGVLVDPVVPYANLTNRHFPTIATAPYVGGLYSIKDSGGYFVPKMLGATTYIGRDWSNTIDATVISNDESARGTDAIFIDPTKYIGNDRGLSKINQLSPIVNISTDPRWQKGSITEGFKSGDIVGARTHQEYIPYQTKYESTGFNFNGLRTQNDEYDPWTGDSDTIWSDPTYFPPNFRNEYDILGWYNNKLPEDIFIYQWKTDIFGNQYALLKDNSLSGVYDKRQAYGQMWMRNQENIIAPISAIFPTYDIYQNSVSPVSYNIKDFDLWYDTIMFKTSSHVIIEHLSFDWDNNTLYTIADDINVIDLSASNGGVYGGHWLFDEEKRVTLCQMLFDYENNTVYPILYNYDIDSVQKTTMFNFKNHYMINALSALELYMIEEPVLTYNMDNRTYNISFVGHSYYYNGIIITSINVNQTLGIDSVVSITPTPILYPILDLVGNPVGNNGAGGAANFVSTAGSAFDPSAELDITIDMRADNWNVSTHHYHQLGYLSKWGSNWTNRQFELHSSSKIFTLGLKKSDEDLTVNYVATEAATLTGRHTVRVASWIDGANRVVRFWVDGVQVGDDVTNADNGNIGSRTGQNNTINWRKAFRGKCYRVEYRNEVDGPIVALMDPNEYVLGDSWVSSTGETWTLNGTAKIAMSF